MAFADLLRIFRGNVAKIVLVFIFLALIFFFLFGEIKPIIESAKTSLGGG